MAKPLHAALVAVLLAGASMGGAWAWKWWQARPKPIEVAMTVTNPPRTPIENEDENDRGPRPLLVKFEHSAAPLSMAGKDVSGGIRITPAVEGKWKWNDD